MKPGTVLRHLGRTATAAILLCGVVNSLASELLPTGTLRATYIGTNPVQAFVDPRSGTVRGPAAELTRLLARRLDVPFTIRGAQGVPGVIDNVKNGEADIGFVAFDPVRAVEVDFAQSYALAQNSYIVPDNSPIRSIVDIDRPGIRIGVGERDAGDYFLSRNLKSAQLKRNPGGNLAIGMKMMASRDIDAYAGNRQRLSEAIAGTPGFRLLPDNFYGVPQAIIVGKGKRALREAVDAVIEEARASGAIGRAIMEAGLVGVDVAPAPPK
jgi:polar amino acid transport system substrate-binding protein